MILQLRHTIIALALLALILWWPTHRALGLMPEGPAYALMPVGIAGLLLTIGALCMLTRRWATLLWLWPVLAALVLIRLTHLGLIQFSGAGFGLEFFLHLEWQSLVLAWQEHGRLIRRAIILIVLLLIPAALLAFRAPRLSPGLAGMALLAGVAALAAGRQAMPEWELIQAWRQWRGPVALEIDEAQLRRWRESGIVETDLPTKQQINASPPESPQNLILLYLESIGAALADHPDWPELLPRFKQLLAEHAFVDHVHASSYVTIEGVTNSQCGTLFPYTRGNDSLAAGDGLAGRMACLGDVLSKAGYYQVYLGGAQKTFAGKGAFLATHGYDEVYGIEEWRELGLDQRPGTWGLSDADLFEQSLVKLRELKGMELPWNLTLLTIGTHLPGFVYDECRQYQGSDAVFLNALHCTDQLLADWIERLEREGHLENALLVITADHHIFPNPDMRELFGDTVYDRRLPFIVIGQELPTAAAPEGGGYDLAPTVLDLLDIRHNARFPLGRSLLDASGNRDYFFRRHDDVVAGERITNNGDRCSAVEALDISPRLPLDSCGKKSLIGVLGALADAYSVRRDSVSCTGETPPVIVRVPAALDEPMEFLIGQSDHSDRFTRSGYPVNQAEPGLYLAAFSDTGEVVSRLFKRAWEKPGEWLSAELAALDARAAIVIWRPRETDSPDTGLGWLGTAPAQAALWLLDLEQNAVMEHRTVSGDGPAFELSPTHCRRLFDSSPSAESRRPPRIKTRYARSAHAPPPTGARFPYLHR